MNHDPLPRVIWRREERIEELVGERIVLIRQELREYCELAGFGWLSRYSWNAVMEKSCKIDDIGAER